MLQGRQQQEPAEATKPRKQLSAVGIPVSLGQGGCQRKVVQGPPCTPAPRKAKQPFQKREVTSEQAKYLADQKEQQKELQRQRKAQYEIENKDKIEDQKASAREWAKTQRRRIAAESKAKTPKATRKVA